MAPPCLRKISSPQTTRGLKTVLNSLEQFRDLIREPDVPFSTEGNVSSSPTCATLTETLDYLASSAAQQSLQTDPYWPKWNSPWWRMTLLYEMGLAKQIPVSVLEAMLKALRKTYLDFFPIRREEIPTGADAYRNIACHCALGTIYQVLSACDIDVDREIPWIRGWFGRYQIADGGLNCDEAAYAKPSPKSSIVSTLPPLEAIIFHARRPLTLKEESFIDRGAEYLIRRQLCRSVSKGMQLIEPLWLQPCFPRFYHYDVLRGLAFLVAWAEMRRKPLPATALAEGVMALAGGLDSLGKLSVRRRAFEGETTLRLKGDGSWAHGSPAKTFPLLEEESAINKPSLELTHSWNLVLHGLQRLSNTDLLDWNS